MPRPPRTKERRLRLAKLDAERAELDAVRNEKPSAWVSGATGCHACDAGVHDPGYGDDGVCRCRCCNRDMTDEGFPWLT